MAPCSVQAGAYFAEVLATAAAIDRAKLEQAADILGRIYSAGGKVYACGNGCSAVSTTEGHLASASLLDARVPETAPMGMQHPNPKTFAKAGVVDKIVQ